MLRELPFGARISDSFVKKLKWETAKANEESPGALPWLCVEERRRHQAVVGRRPQATRIDFGKDLEIQPINRLLPPAPSCSRVTERVWVLCFFSGKHSLPATFDIDGLKLHINPRVQQELKGAIISVVNDKIVVNYETI